MKKPGLTKLLRPPFEPKTKKCLKNEILFRLLGTLVEPEKAEKLALVSPLGTLKTCSYTVFQARSRHHNGGPPNPHKKVILKEFGDFQKVTEKAPSP